MHSRKTLLNRNFGNTQDSGADQEKGRGDGEGVGPAQVGLVAVVLVREVIRPEQAETTHGDDHEYGWKKKQNKFITLNSGSNRL